LRKIHSDQLIVDVARLRAEPLLRSTIGSNEHGTIENMDHFCRFLLKCGVKTGEKTASGLEVNARTLTGSQIRDELLRDDSEQNRP
jgi:hypothetical protein